jgi:hypothetical protein
MMRWFPITAHPDYWVSMDTVIETAQERKTNWMAMQHFYSNPYLSRKWIMQEIRPARKPNIVYKEEDVG